MNDYILITGASRGIGQAIAVKFAENGLNTIIISKNSYHELIQVQSICKKYGAECIPHQCDVSNYGELVILKDYLSTLNINISCIINNAGISYFGLIQDMDIEDWHKIINTNLSSVFYTCKLFVPDMIRSQKGSIINISSVWGNIGASCETAYATSKGGINSLTKALAKELAPSHISVNAISCGAIDTSMNSRLSTEERNALEEEIPFGRMGFPEEVASAVYNLYTTPSYLTGQIITIDGGWT